MDATLIQSQLNQHVRQASHDEVTFSIHYWGVQDHMPANMRHRHSFFELCMIVDGSGWYHEDEWTAPLQSGAVFISRPGVVHQIRTQAGLGILFVAFDIDATSSSTAWCELFRTLGAKSIRTLPAPKDCHVLESIWKSLCIAIANDTPRCAYEPLALALLSAVPQTFGCQLKAPEHPSDTQSPLVNRAIQFVEDNLDRPLLLTEVASYLGVSDRHLTRLFNQTLGMGYNAWLTQARINCSKRLLLVTDTPIKEIAERSGYTSVHYFTNVFHRLTRMTPATYRKQHGRAATSSVHPGTTFVED